MAKPKGKVNEQSLEALKKSIKAGGKKKVAKKETKKTPTPKSRSSKSRSRSRSRTPGRAKKISPAPVKEKKAPRKSAAAKETKVKRLDTEKKPSAKKRTTRPPAGGDTSTKGTYKLRTRTQPSEDQDVTSSTKSHDETPMEINDVSGGKVKEEAGAGSQGWFSKCIIS